MVKTIKPQRTSDVTEERGPIKKCDSCSALPHHPEKTLGFGAGLADVFRVVTRSAHPIHKILMTWLKIEPKGFALSLVTQIFFSMLGTGTFNGSTTQSNQTPPRQHRNNLAVCHQTVAITRLNSLPAQLIKGTTVNPMVDALCSQPAAK